MKMWVIGLGIFLVATISFVLWVFLVVEQNIDKLEVEGCFEKDGVQLKLDDFNRTDYHIKKYAGEFWICPT